MSIELVIVEADGGSRGNPGPAGFGAVVIDPESGEVLVERSDSIGVETNNVAEYRGLIAGLSAALELGARRVHVRMDSKLVVEQMSGRWQVKHPAMRPLAREAAALRARFEQVDFEWIPRERNKRADRLANEAMDRAAGKTSPTRSAPARSEAARPAPLWVPPSEPPTRLVLLRHATTEHSAARRFSGRNKLSLDANGQRQAAELARRAPTLGPVAAVITSPLPRTRETADAVAAALGRPVEVREEFSEVDFGRWEGLTGPEVQERFPADYEAWLGSAEVAPPDGESFAAAARRVRRGRDAVIAAHAGQTVAVVSHVSPIKILLGLALDAFPATMFRIHLDPASVSIIDYFGDGQSQVRLVNDTSHLGR